MPEDLHDFHQLRLRIIDLVQEDYAVIGPVVLFAARVTERSRQTGIARSTVSDKAQRFGPYSAAEASTPYQ